MKNLDNLNKVKYGFLEYRPYPRGYQLKNKEHEGFPIDDTYYIGIRIKNVLDPSINIRDEFHQIDLTDARVRFYNKLQELINDPNKSDFSYLENVKN